MWFEVVGTLLLLAIALELGWIIFKGAHSLKQSQEKLEAAHRTLAETQESLLELTQKLVEAPPATPAAVVAATQPPTQSSAPSNLIVDYGPELYAVLNTLSIAITDLNSAARERSPGELPRRLEEFGLKFEDATRRLYSAIVTSLKELTEERQRLLEMLSSQGRVQQDWMNSLIRALEEALRRNTSGEFVPALLHRIEKPHALESVDETTQPKLETAPPQEEQPAVATANDNDELESTSKPVVQSAQPTPTSSPSNTFAPLQNWITHNLDQIMNRSLNQWSKPEELLQGAPPDLRYTARLLDPDCKLMLVGMEEASQYLAFLLPGGHLSASYYDWFTSPKGIGVRVERTVTPAVLNAFDTGFSVLQRGTVTQY